MKGNIGGPFLQMAVFCEKVLQEQDGVLSAIRIVDRYITQPIPGIEAPDLMPTIKIDVSIIIGLKPGNVTGKHELKIKPTSPSGKDLPGFSSPVLFEGEDQGANLILRYVFEANEEGIYWFDVSLDDNILTKMPLRTIYQKTKVISGTTQPVQQNP
jgi:hypothetical protein